jgi:hypothetical protein
MNKAMSLISKAGVALSVAGLLAGRVLAATLDTTYDYSTLDPGATAVATGFSGIMIVVWCCVMIIGLVGLAFWIWMIVDVVKRTEAELPDKTMWIILVILLGVIGALVYYFVKKRPLDHGKK